MLDSRFVREHIDILREKLTQRGDDIDLSPFIELDQGRRELIQRVEALRSQRNQVSDQISTIKKDGGEPRELIAKMRKVSQEIKDLEIVLKQKEEERSTHRSWPSGG